MSNHKMEQKREHLYTQKLFPTINNDDLLEFRILGYLNLEAHLSTPFLLTKSLIKIIMVHGVHC